MLDQKLFDDMAGRIANLLANSPARDLEKNLRAMITSTFARLDLVTRDEFEVQAALLANCQEKLASLEQRLNALETAGSQAANSQ